MGAFERDDALFDPRFAPMLDSMSGTVSVAKWLRRQVVALEIEGSNPFAHPTPLPPLRLDTPSGTSRLCNRE